MRLADFTLPFFRLCLSAIPSVRGHFGPGISMPFIAPIGIFNVPGVCPGWLEPEPGRPVCTRRLQPRRQDSPARAAGRISLEHLLPTSHTAPHRAGDIQFATKPANSCAEAALSYLASHSAAASRPGAHASTRRNADVFQAPMAWRCFRACHCVSRDSILNLLGRRSPNDVLRSAAWAMAAP